MKLRERTEEFYKSKFATQLGGTTWVADLVKDQQARIEQLEKVLKEIAVEYMENPYLGAESELMGNYYEGKSCMAEIAKKALTETNECL